MKIYLTATSTLPKYKLLYESIHQIISGEKSFEIISSCHGADCVVCVGDITQEVADCKRQENAAVVRFLFRSDISRHFYTDVTMVDYTFWVSDLDINILCPYQQTSEKIAVPFDFAPADSEKSDVPKEFDIYVNTGEFLYADSALFKILRTLNRLTQLKIEVCSKNESIRHLANPNICISDSSGCIESHVKRAQMVIGSGYSALFAIKRHKPLIVLGERGYGGIPTPNNIVQFYHEFFQGTIGGRLDGALPESLVYEDIMAIRSGKATPDLASALSQAWLEIKNRITKQIYFLGSLQRQAVDAGRLRFNTDYTIIQGNGKYWLLNRFTRFIERKIAPSEFAVIKKYIADDARLDDTCNQEVIELLKNMILICG